MDFRLFLVPGSNKFTWIHWSLASEERPLDRWCLVFGVLAAELVDAFLPGVSDLRNREI